MTKKILRKDRERNKLELKRKNIKIQRGGGKTTGQARRSATTSRVKNNNPVGKKKRRFTVTREKSPRGLDASKQKYLQHLMDAFKAKEIEQLKNSLAAAAAQVNNLATTCTRLREKFDIETQQSYDEGLRDGRRLQMETQKMSTKSSL